MNKMNDYRQVGTQSKRLRYFISLGSLLLALIHLTFPLLKIDAITIILIVIAILPWLESIIKSLEIPGWFKIEYNNLRNTTERAESVGLIAPALKKKDQDLLFLSIAKENPNLALAGLRIEIEKRLVALGKAHRLKESHTKGIKYLLSFLAQKNILSTEERSILADIINTLNKAVHGATVDEKTAEWAINIGPRLLSSLDSKVKNTLKSL